MFPVLECFATKIICGICYPSWQTTKYEGGAHAFQNKSINSWKPYYTFLMPKVGAFLTSESTNL